MIKTYQLVEMVVTDSSKDAKTIVSTFETFEQAQALYKKRCEYWKETYKGLGGDTYMSEDWMQYDNDDENVYVKIVIRPTAIGKSDIYTF